MKVEGPRVRIEELRLEGFRAFKDRRSPEWVHPDLRTDGRL